MREFSFLRQPFRLEPSHDYGIVEGVQAPIVDPLGMMGRQWSVGEFMASDGGRPIRMEATTRTRTINQLRLGRDGVGNGFQAIENPKAPLEAAVEAENDQACAPAWDPHHLEYSFAVKSGDFILEASEYDGNHLDWYSVDLAQEGVFDDTRHTVDMRPSPIRYHGQTDPAWFTMEDGKVNLGDLTRPHLNFLTMLLIEYSLLYSEDWFMIPLRQPVNSIRRVDTVQVVDSFGVVTEASPLSGMSEGEVDLFTLARSDGQPTDGRLLVLLNTLWNELESEPIEQVSFIRDEMANVAWAIESRYTNGTGSIVNRHDEEIGQSPPGQNEHPAQTYFDRTTNSQIARPDTFPEGEPGDQLRGPLDKYYEQIMPPAYWIPYLQRYLDEGAVLRRGRTRLDASDPQFKGKLIEEARIVAEHEVGRLGVSVRRFFQVARTTEGTPCLWLGRIKKPAQPRRPSGLLFDALISDKEARNR